MALTVTAVAAQDHPRQFPRGGSKVAVVSVTFDSSYATGGESLVASDVNLNTIDFVIVEPKGGYVFSYDYTNAKIQAYRTKDPAAAGGADIPLPEVANAVDLSLIVTRALVVGR